MMFAHAMGKTSVGGAVKRGNDVVSFGLLRKFQLTHFIFMQWTALNGA